MESVICVDNSGTPWLTLGGSYNVQAEGPSTYLIIDDENKRTHYYKERFYPPVNTVKAQETDIPGKVYMPPGSTTQLKIYVIGSLRNPKVPVLASMLRSKGYNVFDDWYAAGPTADDAWKEYEQARGRTYKEAMQGYAARHVFEFDKKHIDEADIGVMLLPAGKSGHAELGYMKGKGKKCIVYLESDNDRWDIMYNFFDHLVYTDEELLEALNA